MPAAAFTPTLEPAIRRIVAARGAIPSTRAVLVALSGIDGSGKGYVASRLVEALGARGLRAAAVNVDGWLRLPGERFDDADPGGHFYRRALRFEEMFERLVLPLRDRRSVRVEADFAEETAAAYRRHVWAYDDADVVVLEGIFLLKRELRAHYDLSVWVECGFETALERAVARAQEGLPPDQTIAAYRRVYFPAQAIHFERDDPRAAASLVVVNDHRLVPPAPAAGRARAPARRAGGASV